MRQQWQTTRFFRGDFVGNPALEHAGRGALAGLPGADGHPAGDCGAASIGPTGCATSPWTAPLGFTSVRSGARVTARRDLPLNHRGNGAKMVPKPGKQKGRCPFPEHRPVRERGTPGKTRTCGLWVRNRAGTRPRRPRPSTASRNRPPRVRVTVHGVHTAHGVRGNAARPGTHFPRISPGPAPKLFLLPVLYADVGRTPM
jgi:hypothetical protein